MTEMTEDEQRNVFFGLGGGCELNAITYCEAVAWGQSRIRHLERDLRDVQEILNKNRNLRQENEQLSLENENLSKTILKISKSPPLASPESDEETHQQKRRERMLDEITLSSVRGFLHLHAEEKTYREIGVSARDRAEDICRGIDEFDAR